MNQAKFKVRDRVLELSVLKSFEMLTMTLLMSNTKDRRSYFSLCILRLFESFPKDFVWEKSTVVTFNHEERMVTDLSFKAVENSFATCFFLIL